MIRKNKVRIASFVFCVVALGMMLIALRPIFRVTKIATSTRHTSQTKANSFDKVDLVIYDAKDRKIDVSASQVTMKKDNATLKKMTSCFSLSNGENCEISADSANTLSKDIIIFQGNVQLKTGSGLSLSTSQAMVDLGKKSAMGKAHIDISKGENQLSGDDYYIDLDKKYLVLSRNAKAHNSKANIEADQLSATLNKSNKLDNVLAGGNVKYYSKKHLITAKIISFQGNKLTAKGNVKIKELVKHENIYGENISVSFNDFNKVTSVEINGNSGYSSKNYNLKAKEIKYKNGLLQATGNVCLNCYKGIYKYNIFSDSLNAIVVNGKVTQIKTHDKLTIKANNDTIRANSCIMKDNRLFLFGDVIATSSVGGILGDKAELDLSTGRVKIINSSGIIEEGQNAKRNSL